MTRLDQHLVTSGHYETRARASDAIARGVVKINGQNAKKPGQKTAPDALIEIDDPAINYVSRAALKLIAGLDHFKIDVSGRHAIDIGASTGGFTQVLLERDAAHVIALDVGHDQLHSSLSQDSRVTRIDGLNARDLTRENLNGAKFDLIVSDVSFISLKLALPNALELARSGSVAILLVKPQFEAGKEAIGKGGILKDPTLGPDIAKGLLNWLDDLPGWTAQGFIPCPITGADGNQEFIMAGGKA